MRSVLRTLATAGLIFAAAAPAWSEGDVMNDLPGRWSGWGSVQFTNGTSEQLKCVATYFVEGGKHVRQNLRCANQSYNIDAAANISVTNGKIAGEWEEKKWSKVGAVAGNLNGNVFNLSIQGDTFTANMALSSTPCKQNITITPQGFDVKKISIGLGKC